MHGARSISEDFKMEQAGQRGTFSATGGNKPPSREPHREAQDALRHAGDMVTDQARRTAEEAKAAGGSQIAEVSRAVHKAAEELSQGLPQAAGFIHAAADRLDRASSALRERSVEGLVSDFNSFARRQPAAAFAGSVLAGFALSRFLKSSSARPKSETNL
jgi:hypothetical protein